MGRTKLCLLLMGLAATILASCDHGVTGIGNPDIIFKGSNITKIEFDNEGNVWLSASDLGLIKYDGTNSWTYEPGSSTYESGVIWDIAIDSNNNIWMGTSAGLVKFDGSSFTTFSTHNSPMPYESVFKVAVDRDDNIWFSSAAHQIGGLMKYDGSSWTLFTPENSQMRTNIIKDIAVDDNNTIWVANRHSFYRITENEWTVYDSNSTGIEMYDIGSLNMDNHGKLVIHIDYMFSSLWDYSRPNLILGDGDTWSVVNPSSPDGESLGYVQSAAIDNDNYIWAAVHGDNSYLTKRTGSSWEIKNKPDFQINDMVFDSEGRFWLATSNGLRIY